VLAIVWIGMYPQPFLNRMAASTGAVVERVVTIAKLRALQAGALVCPQVEPYGSAAVVQRWPLPGPVPLSCRDSQALILEGDG
jgi:hypothetical protein